MLVYGLLGFLLAPWLLERSLVKTMQQDFDAALRIEKIEINPFALSLRITGLELDNPAGEPSIRLQEMFANFQSSSVFRLALTFDEIRFTDPEIFVTRDDQGNLDLAYLIKSGGSESSPEADSGDEPGSLLQALVFNFVIDDFVVNWHDQVPAEPVKARFGPIAISIRELNTIPARAGQQTVIIATENSGTLSWSGDLQLNPLRSSGHALLEGTEFPLVSAYIRHQTGINIVEGSADIELDYEIFTTESGELDARIDNFDLTLNDIALDSYADGTGFDFAGEDQRFLLLPRVHLSGGQLRWPQQTVSLESVTVENPKIDVTRDASGIFNLEPRQPSETNPAIASSDTSPTDENADSAGQDPWQVSIGALAVNGLALTLLDRSVSPEAKLGVVDLNLEISDLSNLPGKRFPTSLSLQALSGGNLSARGEFSLLPELLFDFDIGLDAIQLAGIQPYIAQQANLSLDSGAVNLEGQVSSNREDPFSLRANLEVVDLNLSESINRERLASWKSFRVENIAFTAAENQLDISRMRFDQLYGDVLINEDGSLNVGEIKKETASTAPEKDSAVAEVAAQAETGQDGLTVRIGEISINNASADFADRSLPLPFATKIDALNGNMTTISTGSNEPSEVALEGKVDEFGFARVSGVVTPLDPTLNTDLLLSFENIDVPSFTPYSIPFAGREVANGKLDLKLGYVVRNGQLAGENSIVLRDFELGEKVPHPDAMDVPLGLAVALLKDSSGKIDINLPVRGNLDDPEFSYGSVVMTALGRFLVKIVLYPFQAIGGLLGVEASELEHIKFLDGRSDLTPPELEKAGKLAEALALRPELNLVIAGVSDADSDGLAMQIARLDEILDQKIAEVAANSDPEIQYADLKLLALEQLYGEQSSTDLPTPAERLEQLQQQNTRPVVVEGQTDPVPTLDKLAYASAIRNQLISRQVIEEADLAVLATARAESLKTALLGIDENLVGRIEITENQSIQRDKDEPVKMKVSLSGKSD